MPKRQKSNLSLHRRKRRRVVHFVTPTKRVKIFPRKTAAYTTPMKAGRLSRRLRTLESLPRASRKKLHTYESPKYKAETVINENVIFDELEETISEENKEYIDIARYG